MYPLEALWLITHVADLGFGQIFSDVAGITCVSMV